MGREGHEVQDAQDDDHSDKNVQYLPHPHVAGNYRRLFGHLAEAIVLAMQYYLWDIEVVRDGRRPTKHE